MGRLSSFLGASGASTIRVLLIAEVIVLVGGLAVGTTIRLPVMASIDVVASPMSFASTGIAENAASDGKAAQLIQLHLSTAEFGAALRASEVSSGTWDPSSKSFIVELTGADAARLRAAATGRSGS